MPAATILSVFGLRAQVFFYFYFICFSNAYIIIILSSHSGGRIFHY